MKISITLSALLLTTSVAVAQTAMPVPGFTRTFSGQLTRGFWFQAPTTFIISGLEVPDETGAGIQNVELIVQQTPFVAFPGTTTGGTQFVSTGQPSGTVIQTGGIVVNQGDFVGVLGACGTGTMANSYGGPGPFQSSILGMPVTIDRFLTQSNLNTTGGMQPVSTEPGGDISRVDVYVAPAAGFASATPYGSGCGGTDPASFYEVYGPNNAFDLNASGFQLIWTGNTYIGIPAVNGFTTPTNVVGFTDDQTQQIALPAPMATASGMVSDVWVCSNGWVSFDSTTSADFSETVAELLNDPLSRIAVFWDDLNPAAGGQMFVDTIGPVMHVTWQNVPEFGGSNMNTFQISFDTQTSSIEVNYVNITAADGIVGYSPINDSTDPGGIDISAELAGQGIVLGTGVPDMSLAVGSRPVIAGPPATVDLNDIPAGAIAGSWLLGTTAPMPGIPLDIVGATGCFLNAQPNLGSIPFTPMGTSQQFSLSIPTPSMGSFVGLNLFVQGAVIAPATNPLGVATSNGVQWSLDNN